MEAAPQTSPPPLKLPPGPSWCGGDEVRPLSSEFTPETERQRIQQLVGALSGEDVDGAPALGHQREPDLSKASYPRPLSTLELLAVEFT